MFKDIILTIVHLIISPNIAWKDVSAEAEDQTEFLNRFLHPVFGIIALTSFIGGLWFTRDGNLQSALKEAIVSVVSVYGGYYIASYAINEIAPRFDLEKHLFSFQRFVGYSSVLLYVLYMILPFLSDFYILWFAALYTAYIVYAGAAIFFGISETKRMSFTVAATSLMLLVPGLITGILSFLIK